MPTQVYATAKLEAQRARLQQLEAEYSEAAAAVEACSVVRQGGAGPQDASLLDHAFLSFATSNQRDKARAATT